MEQILAGKVAIVTGGASGIGKAIAEEFAQAGAKVVVADINQKEARKVKGIALAIKTDVTKPKQIKNLIKRTVKELGRINILVNNAGVTKPTKILDPAVVDSWLEVIGVDLNGSFLVTEQVAKAMVKRLERIDHQHHLGPFNSGSKERRPLYGSKGRLGGGHKIMGD
jgi:NAD(P)-dependent dehydrogenase (short-subunit alcohol dehydrogenase family)